jgi:hypothetical protein
VVLPRINELESQNERRQILMLVAASAQLALVYYPLYAYLAMGPEVLTVLFTERCISLARVRHRAHGGAVQRHRPGPGDPGSRRALLPSASAC